MPEGEHDGCRLDGDEQVGERMGACRRFAQALGPFAEQRDAGALEDALLSLAHAAPPSCCCRCACEGGVAVVAAIVAASRPTIQPATQSPRSTRYSLDLAVACTVSRVTY